MSFWNPDAVKKNKFLPIKQAFWALTSVFKPIERDTEFKTREFWKAEEEVMKELLLSIAVHEEGKE